MTTGAPGRFLIRSLGGRARDENVDDLAKSSFGRSFVTALEVDFCPLSQDGHRIGAVELATRSGHRPGGQLLASVMKRRLFQAFTADEPQPNLSESLRDCREFARAPVEIASRGVWSASLTNRSTAVGADAG